jgi:hypothetical protein
MVAAHKVAPITAFLSYAHADLGTDPALVAALTAGLESRIKARFFKTEFQICMDTEILRTGDAWNPTLDQAVRSADILIVLLSPKWLESDFCKREFSTFQERGDRVDCVIPLVIRSVDRQIQRLDDGSRLVFEELMSRQYFDIFAPDFRRMSANQRVLLVERLADNVMGVIERIQSSKDDVGTGASILRRVRVIDSEGRAQNFADIDLVSSAEVAIDPPRSSGTRPVLAQVSFVERLYIDADNGRFEFGVRRAYMSVWSDNRESLRPTESVRASGKFVDHRDHPGGISLCLDPEGGHATLSDLTLPVTGSENYFSHVGDLDGSVGIEAVHAALKVEVSPEGLKFLDERRRISWTLRQKLEAIMSVAVAKVWLETSSESLHRTIEVRERRP